MLLPGHSIKGVLLGFAITVAQAQAPAAPPASAPARADRERLDDLLQTANRLESSQPQEALERAIEGLALAVKAGDKAKEAAFLSSAAFSCTQTGDFSMAVEYANRALVLGTELGDKDRVARAHNILGITYTFIGTYSKALEEGFEALRLREELGQSVAISQSLNLIGVIYHHSGQYEKAIDQFNQVLKRTESRSDPKRRILAQHNLGFAQYKLGRLSESLRNHLEALALAKEFKETAYVPYAYLNLGLTYSGLKQFDKAREYLGLARTEYGKLGQRHGLVQVLRAMAQLHQLSGEPLRGVSLAKEAADLASQINSRDELKLCYELIAEMYEKAGNLPESYRYFKLAAQTKDTIYSVAESHKMAEASMKLVTLKKDNEIEVLKKEKVISGLKIEKQRYSQVILVSSIGFLVAFLLVLGAYSRKVRQHRALLERANDELARINRELQERMNEVKALSGLLPICAQCKKIRDDAGYWTQLEGYISEHSEATFSHGICPDCTEELYPELVENRRAMKAGGPESSANPTPDPGASG
jgi:tetratricopeptide (TPR) repeat protein